MNGKYGTPAYEWKHPAENHIGEHPEGPHVDRLAVSLAGQKLRRTVAAVSEVEASTRVFAKWIQGQGWGRTLNGRDRWIDAFT